LSRQGSSVPAFKKLDVRKEAARQRKRDAIEMLRRVIVLPSKFNAVPLETEEGNLILSNRNFC
jgi:hypothetical protein